jgi:hypothetical protein
MAGFNKASLLLLMFILAASTLLMIQPASAQTKPSVPEFTVRVINRSYDVQASATTTTDPYDGHITTTTTPGYRMVNGSIEISIKNQPFTSYYDSNGYPIKLYYHVQAKGLDSANWRFLHGEGPDSYFEASNSTYTTVSCSYSGHSFEPVQGHFVDYRADGTIDFQVEAFIGYKNVTNINPTALVARPDDLHTEFVGQTSGWSSIQTATIPDGSYTIITPTPPAASPIPASPYPSSQNPTATPSQSDAASAEFRFNFSWVAAGLFAVLAVVVVALLIAALVYARRKIRVLERKGSQKGV